MNNTPRHYAFSYRHAASVNNVSQHQAQQYARERLHARAQAAGYGEHRMEAQRRIEFRLQQAHNSHSGLPMSELNLQELQLTSLPPHLDILLPQLTRMNISGNHLSTLDGLQSMHALTHLNARNNRLSSLTALSTCFRLRELDVSENSLSSLAGLPEETRVLKAGVNDLESLENMPFMPAIEWLSVPLNNISSLAGIELLYSLKTLDLNVNPIQEGELGRIPGQLQYLELRSCSLNNLAGIEGIEMLTHLDVQNNALSNLNELADLNNLTCLNAINNAITDISGLREREQTLAIWNLSGNPVESAGNYQNLDTIPVNEEAYNLWQMPEKADAYDARTFLDQCITPSMQKNLSALPDGRALLLLCAGQVFTAEAENPGKLKFIQNRMTQHISWIEKNMQNEKIIQEILTEIKETVQACSDMVSYGATLLHRLIEKHQMAADKAPGSVKLQRIKAYYNQVKLEELSLKLYQQKTSHLQNNADESVEFYLNLVSRLMQKDKSIPLLEKSTSAHFRLHPRAEEHEINEIISKLRNTDNEETWKAALREDPAIYPNLPQVFHGSFEIMKQHRERLAEVGMALSEGSKVDMTAQLKNSLHYAYGPDYPDINHPESGLNLMTRSGMLETEWREKRLQEVIARPALLDKVTSHKRTLSPTLAVLPEKLRQRWS